MFRSSIVQRKAAIVQLGEFLNSVSHKQEWGGFKIGVSEVEFNEFQQKMNTAFHHNGWFTKVIYCATTARPIKKSFWSAMTFYSSNQQTVICAITVFYGRNVLED